MQQIRIDHASLNTAAGILNQAGNEIGNDALRSFSTGTPSSDVGNDTVAVILTEVVKNLQAASAALADTAHGCAAEVSALSASVAEEDRMAARAAQLQ